MILTNKNIRIELRDHLFRDVPKEKIDLDPRTMNFINKIAGSAIEYQSL